MARSGDGSDADTHPDPDGLPGRPDESSGDGSIVGYRPRIDYPAAGVETVVVRIAVSGPAAPVAAGLRGPPFTDVYEVAGAHDVVAVGRFRDRAELAATLAGLAADPRVGAIATSVVLATGCEYDTEPLLDREDG